MRFEGEAANKNRSESDLMNSFLLKAREGSTAFGSVHGQAESSEDSSKTVCAHCGMKGHGKSECWILHPNLKTAKKANVAAGGQRSTGGAGTNAINCPICK